MYSKKYQILLKSILEVPEMKYVNGLIGLPDRHKPRRPHYSILFTMDKECLHKSRSMQGSLLYRVIL
jgi:hypothetical protein